MKLQAPSFRRYQVAVVTIAVLSIILLSYFFVYVENKKSYLHERAFRILSQDNDNLNKKNENIIKNARNEISYRNSIDPNDIKKGKLTPGYTKLRVNELETRSIPGLFNKQLTYTNIFPYQPPSDKSGENIISDRRIVKSNGQVHPRVSTTDILEIKPGNKSVETFSSYLRNEADGWHIYYQDTVHVIKIQDENKGFEPLMSLRIDFNVRLKEFSNSALIGLGEAFDGYLLVKDSLIILETLPSGIELNGQDSLFSRSTKPQSNHVRDIELSGVQYKMFTQKVSIGQIDHLILCGLVTDKHYRDQIYTIPMLTILVIILLALLMALGYPFFKLLIMSSGERLQVDDAFFSVFSVVAGSFLSMLILFSGYNYWITGRDKNDEDLKRLTTSIQSSFTQELDSIYHQLAHYKSEVEKNRGSLLIPRKTLLSHTTGFYPQAYPYLDDVFWVGAKGATHEYWTTDTLYHPSAIDVSDRSYFKNMKDKTPWTLKTAADTNSFMLCPVFNRVTNENMAVVSIPFDPFTTPEGKIDSLRAVLAMDVRLYSVINPVLPMGYGFCILDNTREVWFHSDQQKNLQEQFIKECEEDKDLRAAISGDAKHLLDLTYNGKAYRALVSPFAQIPLHLIVFHDADYPKSVSSMAISMSCILYVLAFSPLVVLLLIHKVTFSHHSKLRGENFAFQWLSPRIKKEPLYTQLLYIFSGLIALDLLLLYFIESPLLLMLGYAITIASSFVIARFFLYDYSLLSSKRIKKYAFWVLYLVMVVMLMVMFYNRSTLLTKIGIISFSLFAPLLVHYLYWRSTSHLSAFPTGQDSLKKRYSAFLCAWVIILSVLPAIAFYRSAYNNEQVIATGHQLLTLARNLTSRKVRIEKQYRERNIEEPPVIDSLIKNKGNYAKAFETIYYCPGPGCNDAGYKPLPVSSALLSMRPDYSPIITDNKYILSPDTVQGNWKWQRNSRSQLRLTYNEYDLANPHKNYLALMATPTVFSFPSPFEKNGFQYPTGFLFWVVVLLVLAGWFELTRYAAVHVFNLGLFEELPSLIGSKDIQQYVAKPGERTFLSGPHLTKSPEMWKMLLENMEVDLSTHKSVDDIIKEELQKRNAKPSNGEAAPREVKAKAVDGAAAAIAGKAKESTGTNGLDKEKYDHALIITHFEEVIQRSTDEESLELLEHLYQENNKYTATLIISDRDPAQISKELKQILASKKPETGPKETATQSEQKAATAKKKISADLVINHWEELLADFRTEYYHLNTFSDSPENTSPENNPNGKETPPKEDTGFKRFIRQQWQSIESLFPFLKPPSKRAKKESDHSNGLIKLINTINKECRHKGQFLENLGEEIKAALAKEIMANQLVGTRSKPDNAKKVKAMEETKAKLIEEIKANFPEEAEGPLLKEIEAYPYEEENKNENALRKEKRILTESDGILRIQELARFHYSALWRSCTREEQYMLYDLAQDGLVNSKNNQVLTALVKKGLLLYDGTIRLMNRSFRNFILSFIQPQEGLNIERETQAKGAWSEFKIPLLLVTVTIIGFIFFTQRETYNQIIAIITTAAGSIPLILKLVGSFNSKEKASAGD